MTETFKAGDILHTKSGLRLIVEVNGEKILARNPNSNRIEQYDLKDTKDWMTKDNIYTITIQSPFILTSSQVKSKLGIGYKVLTVEAERDIPNIVIKDVDSAVENIIKTGYRALARANHPDLGGDPEVMVILNRAKKEIVELMESLR